MPQTIFGGQVGTETLRSGKTLTVTLSAGSGGVVEQFNDGARVAASALTSTTTFGPFVDDTVLRISANSGATLAVSDQVDQIAQRSSDSKQAAVDALVSGAGIGSVARRRDGRRLQSANVASGLRTFMSMFVVPVDALAFRIGTESVSPADLTIALTKYAVCGTPSNTPTQAIEAASAYHSDNSASGGTAAPVQVLYSGAATCVVPKLITAIRPGQIAWSDWTFTAAKMQRGQTLVVRRLINDPGAGFDYPYASLGYGTYTDILDDTLYPQGSLVATTDRVTTNVSWTVTASGVGGNLYITHIEYIAADAKVVNVCAVGDSTESGEADVDTDQPLTSVRAACEALSTSAVHLSPISRGWGGRTAQEYYELLIRQIDEQRPDVLMWLIWSQNKTGADLTLEKALILDVLKRCWRNGIVPILNTGIPTNSLASDVDAARKALNDYARGLGVIVCDRDAVITDGATPARRKTQYGTTTTAHCNKLGYTDMVAQAYIPAIRQAVAQFGLAV